VAANPHQIKMIKEGKSGMISFTTAGVTSIKIHETAFDPIQSMIGRCDMLTDLIICVVVIDGEYCCQLVPEKELLDE